MARRSAPPPFQPAHLTPDQKQTAIRRLEKRIAELKELNPRTIEDRWTDPRVTQISHAVDRALVEIFGAGSAEYVRYESAKELYHGAISFGDPLSQEAIQEGFRDGIKHSLAILEGIVTGFKEDLEEFGQPPSASTILTAPDPSPASPKVFVVHGHDEGVRESVARFIEKLGLEAIILHEQPNQGRTIVEKFEACAGEVGFAVVLLTPDDVGGAQAGEAQPRARQNVIFELGYFAGKLGRGRVCLLRKGEIEGFSDFNGVVYTAMDAGDGWKWSIARELKAAGFEFDLNKVVGA